MYIKDFYRNYYAPVCLAHAKKKTLAAYDQVVELWVKVCGNCNLSEISPEFCQRFVSTALGKVKPTTVAKYCRHINAVFLKMSFARSIERW